MSKKDDMNIVGIYYIKNTLNALVVHPSTSGYNFDLINTSLIRREKEFTRKDPTVL